MMMMMTIIIGIERWDFGFCRRKTRPL